MMATSLVETSVSYQLLPRVMKGGTIQRVAIIGAGAGGLVVSHRLTSPQHPLAFQVTVFEQSDNVGGTWVYREETGTDTHGLPIHSSMYKNLRTNLPKESMAFLDFSFPAGGQSYIAHQEVLQYLRDYCDHFELKKHIHFNTLVKEVHPEEGGATWHVKTENVVTKCVENHQFEAVAVCTGHYSQPCYPRLPGLDCFQGKVVHSHDYRAPDPFTGLTVVCLGAGPSGIDIAVELGSVNFKKVFLCHGGADLGAHLPDSVRVMPWPKSCSQRSVHFEDATVDDVGAIIVCTGYHYAFPFLSDACQVAVVDNRVTPLYKHLIHTVFPSMAFFGLPWAVIPFPLMDVQAQVFRRVLEGALTLPPRSEMDDDTERDLQGLIAGRRCRPRYFHKMGPLLMQCYLDDLTTFANIACPVPDLIHKLYAYCVANRTTIPGYRDTDFDIVGDEFFVRKTNDGQQGSILSHSVTDL